MQRALDARAAFILLPLKFTRKTVLPINCYELSVCHAKLMSVDAVSMYEVFKSPE